MKLRGIRVARRLFYVAVIFGRRPLNLGREENRNPRTARASVIRRRFVRVWRLSAMYPMFMGAVSLEHEEWCQTEKGLFSYAVHCVEILQFGKGAGFDDAFRHDLAYAG